MQWHWTIDFITATDLQILFSNFRIFLRKCPLLNCTLYVDWVSFFEPKKRISNWKLVDEFHYNIWTVPVLNLSVSLVCCDRFYLLFYSLLFLFVASLAPFDRKGNAEINTWHFHWNAYKLLSLFIYTHQHINMKLDRAFTEKWCKYKTTLRDERNNNIYLNKITIRFPHWFWMDSLHLVKSQFEMKLNHFTSINVDDNFRMSVWFQNKQIAWITSLIIVLYILTHWFPFDHFFFKQSQYVTMKCNICSVNTDAKTKIILPAKHTFSEN